MPRDLLQIAPEQFLLAEQARLGGLDRRFDVACSLEYAEHLPAEHARDLVALLAGAAPVVLFSAAVPGQGGLGHVNEQRQSWWAALFAERGLVPVDCIRPAIQDAPGVEWYYAQNTLVYCPPQRVPEGLSPVANPLYLDLIDDHVFGPMTQPPDSLSGSLRALRRDGAALWLALRRRALGRRAGRLGRHAEAVSSCRACWWRTGSSPS